MKLTKQLLKQLIKEQLANILREAGGDSFRGGPDFGTAVGTVSHPSGEALSGAAAQRVDKARAECLRTCIKNRGRVSQKRVGKSFESARWQWQQSEFRGTDAQLKQHCERNVCREPTHQKPVTQQGDVGAGPALGLKNCDQLPRGRKRRQCEKHNAALLKKSDAGKAYGKVQTKDYRGLSGACEEGELETINGQDMTCKNGKWLKLQGSSHKWGGATMQESQYSSFPKQKKLFENLRKFANNKKEDK